MSKKLLIALLVMLISTSVIAAEPALAPDAPVIRLDDIGNYQVGYVPRGKAEKQFARGWTGHFEESTGVSCIPFGEINGKRAFLLHCPWINFTGAAFQQFTFSLPKISSIRLTGATAIRSESVGKSDGATFRAYVQGDKLLDVNRADANWKPFDLDLTPYAGRTVTIRFETDPGPKDDPGFDFSIWGDRQLILKDYHPKVVKRPGAPKLDLSKMISQQGTVVPPCAHACKPTITLTGEVATFKYVGPDGCIEYVWKRPEPGSGPLLGTIVMNARMTGDKPVEVALANGANAEWATPAMCEESRFQPAGRSGIVSIRTFRVGNQLAVVKVEGRLIGKSLVFDLTCDKPLIKRIDTGGWLPGMRRVPVTVPYYSGQVSYLPTENMFVNAFLDWTWSNASALEGSRAVYNPLTDSSRNTLKERIIYSASWNLPETLPSIPNPPSPYLRQVGSRIVLDTWGGRFDDIAAKLQTLHDLGIDHCIVLVHDWQRSGYDNALPMHYPAQANYGGEEGMKKLVDTAKRLGYLIALHENYADYYPNFDSFDPNDIALLPNGKPMNAWYNPGTKIQSFAEKPNSILKYAGQQSPEIKRRYGSNANYLDVHSAVPPWFHVDARAGEEGAGMFSRVRDVQRDLWAFERKTFGGPVFGEGNNHWYWSGFLDGVEAQFGAGWGPGNGTTAPLAVDFDLLRIHPLEMNHGMGYYERWDSKVSWGRTPPLALLDQYRMQEIAYGHNGFLGASTWSIAPYAWLEHNLTTPVSARYATARPISIRYRIDGKWVDGSAAAKAKDWSIVDVCYSNGLRITANSSDRPIQVNGHTIPRFGWMAQGNGVTAYTGRIDGDLVDYAETKDSIFANARNARDWSFAGTSRITPTVKQFRQTAARQFTVTYSWNVNSTLDKDYTCFVHFYDPTKPEEDCIRFQQDHTPVTPTSKWKHGADVADGPYVIDVPNDVKDGDYVWGVGLYSKEGGPRVSLMGNDDGTGRIRLGIVKVRDGGEKITFEPEAGSSDEQEKLYASAMNELTGAVDFGAVRTDGSVLLRREGNDWVLRAWPRTRSFDVDISARRIKMPASVTVIDGGTASMTPECAGQWWKLTLTGAKEYRWKAK